MNPLEEHYDLIGNQIKFNDLTVAQHYELKILEVIHNQHDDLADLVNMQIALANIQRLVSETIQHYYPHITE